MAAVLSPTSPPRTPRRRNYRALIGILAVQAFANQMAASFWLVYLVSPPQSLDFDVAILAGITATFAITGVLAPIVGGWIADRVSYRLVFGLAGVGVTANLLFVRWLAQSNETLVFSLDLKRVGRRTALAFSGQGGVDGLISAATPLGSFLFTSASFELGLLFALFSLAAGIAAGILGRVSDRVRVRTPFLLLGPLLSVPACLPAYLVRDLGAFAFAIGWLSMTSAVAPSFIYTILIDRTEKEIPTVTATRELILNTSRTLLLLGGLAVLALGGDVYALYLLVGGVILLEALAK